MLPNKHKHYPGCFKNNCFSLNASPTNISLDDRGKTCKICSTFKDMIKYYFENVQLPKLLCPSLQFLMYQIVCSKSILRKVTRYNFYVICAVLGAAGVG